MKNISFIRLAIGAGIILAGLAALLGSFEIVNFSQALESYWPLLLVVAGIVVLIDSPRQNYVGAVLLIALGVIAQLNVLEVIDVSFWQIFMPAVLIVVGWSILTHGSRAKSASTDNITAILGGAENKNRSKDFKNSNVTAVLGGASIDLGKADIKKEATIDVLAILGGAELRIPEGWEVRVAVTSILGGVENKTSAPSKANAPVLNIVGTAILGGVEIKN